MKKWLGWLGLVAAGIVGLILVASAAVYGFSEARYRKEWSVQSASIAIPADSVSIARGDHIVHSIGGCIDCHGEKLQGQKMIDDPVFGKVFSINLTRGKGGAASTFSDADFVRAIRHGIGPNNRSLKIMPSKDYQHLTDADLGAVIAYLRSAPPVDNETPAPSIGPLARALMVAGKLPFLAAEEVNHATKRESVPAGVTPEYGKYLASIGCMGCHGPGLAGGPVAGAPPDFPPAANLTPQGKLKTWSEADFRTLIRTGMRPGNIPVNEAMPWKVMKNLSDEEISAIWTYLKTLPATPTPGLQTASR